MELNKVNINFIKLNEKAIKPLTGSEYAAGSDLYSCDDDIVINPNETVLVHTGIAIEIPVGLVGLIYARSSMACKRHLAPANKVGVIDSDYRGEIMVALHNHSSEPATVEHGERIAQIVFTPYYAAEFKETESLSDTVRGDGGFGSTGTK